MATVSLGPGEDEVPDRPREWIAEIAMDADDFLAGHIAAALVADPHLTIGGLRVTVQNRVVMLDGQVGTADDRIVAAGRVWAVPAVLDVCNRLAVRPAATP
jgi:osmotically-inducible protein OsmY